ncbi:MAG: hypothetical protein WAN36_14785 [Calditrichia bacterium]
MIDKLFKPVFQLFAAFGSALAGIGAALTAFGFLAERSHLVMLGFTEIPVNLNQYLFTGAKFIAYLPFLILTAVALTSIEALQRYFIFSLLLAILIFLYLVIRRWKRTEKFRTKFRLGFTSFLDRFKGSFLVLLIILQFIIIYQWMEANKIQNLLFAGSRSEMAVSNALFVNHNVLEYWILSHHYTELFQYFGRMFLLTVMAGFFLWIVFHYSKKKATLRKQLAFILNIILLVTQVLLVPINFGTLLMPNTYPHVELSLNEPASRKIAPLQTEAIYLLHRENQNYYFYSAVKARLWMIKDKDINMLTYLGREDIFKKKSR